MHNEMRGFDILVCFNLPKIWPHRLSEFNEFRSFT